MPLKHDAYHLNIQAKIKKNPAAREKNRKMCFLRVLRTFLFGLTKWLTDWCIVDCCYMFVCFTSHRMSSKKSCAAAVKACNQKPFVPLPIHSTHSSIPNVVIRLPTFFPCPKGRPTAAETLMPCHIRPRYWAVNNSWQTDGQHNPMGWDGLIHGENLRLYYTIVSWKIAFYWQWTSQYQFNACQLATAIEQWHAKWHDGPVKDSAVRKSNNKYLRKIIIIPSKIYHTVWNIIMQIGYGNKIYSK